MCKSDKLLYTCPRVFFIITALQQLLRLVGQARVEGKPDFKQLIRTILMLKVSLFLFIQERDGSGGGGRTCRDCRRAALGFPVIWGSPETLSVPTQSTGLTQPSREEARRVQWAPVSADGNPSARAPVTHGSLLTQPPGPTCWRPLLPADPAVCAQELP